MKISELLLPGEYTAEGDLAELSVTRPVSDPRALHPGCLFLCLRGLRFDTHTLLKKVEEAGAAAVVVEKDVTLSKEPGIPILRVKNARATLALVFSRFYGSPEKELCMIGITGTNGKTSTSTILYHILRTAGIEAGLIGTAECRYGDRFYVLPEEEGDRSSRLRTMTTPDPDILFPILRTMADAGVTHVVMEVSSHALSLDKVFPIDFEVGIFTNLSPEHMDFHNDMHSYLQAKAKLFSRCRIGIINCDSDYAEDLILGADCRVLRLGVIWQGERRATDITLLGSRGIRYSYIAPGIRLKVRSPLPGSFSVYNTLLALSAAIELGVSPPVAAEALNREFCVPGRMESVPTDNEPFSVFIDYAHTEEALRALLRTVRSFRNPGQRIVLLFGCGGDRDKSKRAPMGAVAEELADRVIITSDNCRTEEPEAIISDILAGIRFPDRVTVIENRRRAIFTAILDAKEGDILLLVGKGHETYDIGKSGIRHFDERKIVAAALKKRREGDTTDEN